MAASVSQAPHPVAIASFKAFGDFVIAHSVVSAIREHRERVRILGGSHLDELAAVLPDGVTVTRVQVGDDRLPAVFDARLRGIAAALRSAVELERALRRVERRPNEALVVDRPCWRSRWIGRSWVVTSATCGARNIYEDYAQALDKRGFAVSLESEPHPVRGRRVGIFPGSRIAEKAIPDKVLRIVVSAIERAGVSANIVRVDGEAAINGLPSTTIPRTFKNLAEAIAGVDLVVSADSLPAHLGEYLGRPVFVISSVPNPYWLPYRCFTHDHSSLFMAPDIEIALRRFLDGAAVSVAP